MMAILHRIMNIKVDFQALQLLPGGHSVNHLRNWTMLGLGDTLCSSYSLGRMPDLTGHGGFRIMRTRTLFISV